MEEKLDMIYDIMSNIMLIFLSHFAFTILMPVSEEEIIGQQKWSSFVLWKPQLSWDAAGLCQEMTQVKEGPWTFLSSFRQGCKGLFKLTSSGFVILWSSNVCTVLCVQVTDQILSISSWQCDMPVLPAVGQIFPWNSVLERSWLMIYDLLKMTQTVFF